MVATLIMRIEVAQSPQDHAPGRHPSSPPLWRRAPARTALLERAAEWVPHFPAVAISAEPAAHTAYRPPCASQASSFNSAAFTAPWIVSCHLAYIPA